MKQDMIGEARRVPQIMCFLKLIAVFAAFGHLHSGAAQKPSTLEDKQFYAKAKKEELLRAFSVEKNCQVAKNVILFVGDGMGLPIITASRIFKGQQAGKPGEETYLNFEKFPHLGLMRTYCVDRQVPDSGCTATALLTGVNGLFMTVGLDAHGKLQDCVRTMRNNQHFPTSIMTHAQRAGKRTGIVTTTRVTHATTAAAFAHTPSRQWESDTHIPEPAAAKCSDISRQLIETEPGRNFNVVLGGGSHNFLPIASGGSRNDSRNLINEWQQNSAQLGRKSRFVTSRNDLLDAARNRSTEFLLGLFHNSHMEFVGDKDAKKSEEPSLGEMTEAAIQILDNKNGFVLLVEGGRIDHALHNNNAKRAILELLAFEEAIDRALKLTKTQETLIIVASDHSHVMSVNGYPKRGNPILGIAGIQPHYKLPYTTLMFANGVGYNYALNSTHVSWRNVTGVKTHDIDFRQQAATFQPEGGETHGGEDVPAYAIGPWAHLVNGVHDLAYIGHVTQFAACLGDYSNTCTGNLLDFSTRSRRLKKC
ncbi:unnamed protein product [Notodromas monacha]|uniref:Alkaline phosphatase n=1 Tax=Notodromas monacha TaxID=399045 RepID=A0A7R9GGF6_9CRUS|nr:unnamed protein product [Notodromas monacha]CAG0921797.1 unnamed protein product [Notodromas monacha]